jgi:adenosine deaminase
MSSMAEMHAWAGENFGNPVTRLRPRLFEAAFARASEDGLVRYEIGDDVWAITLDGSAEKVTEILKLAHERGAPDVEWIPQLGMSRHCRIEDIRRWMEPFLALHFYRTVDLSGDEFAQPIENFKPLYRLAKANGLRLKAHVGEWGDADSVRRAVEELELDEVQHGIAAAESPTVMRFLAENRIRLNICPTSNLMLGRVESLRSHPIRKLFDAGVRVTVNTDDMAMFGQSVSDEFLNLFKAGCMNEKELDQIRENGLSD